MARKKKKAVAKKSAMMMKEKDMMMPGMMKKGKKNVNRNGFPMQYERPGMMMGIEMSAPKMLSVMEGKKKKKNRKK